MSVIGPVQSRYREAVQPHDNGPTSSPEKVVEVGVRSLLLRPQSGTCKHKP